MSDLENIDVPLCDVTDENIFFPQQPESRLTLDLQPPVGFEEESYLFQGSDFKDKDDLGIPNLSAPAPPEQAGGNQEVQEFPDFSYIFQGEAAELPGENGPSNEFYKPNDSSSMLDNLETQSCDSLIPYKTGDSGTPSKERSKSKGIPASLKSSVKVVVWSKSKRPALQPLGNHSGYSGNRNLFIVNHAKRKPGTEQSVAPISHDKDKVSKKRRKVEFVTDSPHSNKSNPKKIGEKVKGGRVKKLSKPEKYKRYIQSFISVISKQECLPKTEKMKENGDSNLMWLLDFKVDTLFQPPPPPPPAQEANFCSEFENIMADLQTDHPEDSSFMNSATLATLEPAADQQLELPPPSTTTDDSMSNFDPMNPEHAFTVDLEAVDNVANFEQVESESIQQEQMPVENTMTETKNEGEPTKPNEYHPPEITFDEQGKPRCTYTDLIERALTASGGLTVSEIYQWISDNYPFFRADDDRWKNSVRHNLSINPYFKKGEKARSGAGHLWTISEESRALRPALRKKDSECEEINMLIENDTDRAVASILGQYNLAKANLIGKPSFELSPVSKKPAEVTANKHITSVAQENVEPIKPTEEATAPVFLEYDPGNDFSEFTIELNGLNGLSIPESGSFEFQDLLSNGRLIVIQSEDQDSDKENSLRFSDATLQNLDDYMGTDFHVMQTETPNSTETERVSGQLISEALTQDFECIKNSEKITNNSDTNGYHLSVGHFERLPGSSDSDDFMNMESMDPASLQEVIQNPANHGESEQFHNILNLSGNSYEPKDLSFCEYEHEITL